jgi:general secretion pathway protein D
MTMSGVRQIGWVVSLAVLASACASSSAFDRGDEAAKLGDVDSAVAYYRAAVQADPTKTEYKIALEFAMLTASRTHLERARKYEAADELEAARREYQLASDYDATNRQAAEKALALGQEIRRRAEASRPPSAFEQARDAARIALQAPTLDLGSPAPTDFRFNGSLRDVLGFVGNSVGINITFERDVVDRTTSIELEGVTVQQALNYLMSQNQLSYKIINPRSIFVFPDTQQKHALYDEQVFQIFHIAHADPEVLAQLANAIVRMPGMAILPVIQANKAANTIIVRGTREVVAIIERLIAQNDRPQAEIVVDVQIMEVNRTKVKQYGLDLGSYSVSMFYSPERRPESTLEAINTPPINLGTITQGLSTGDFYVGVPSAVARFLETEATTKLVAKTQLRGSEGAQLTLNLGEDIPVITTSYVPLAAGGANTNPLNSYEYRAVGINVDLTPRVSLDGDILMELRLENSARGADVDVGGVSVPSFAQRVVTTRLRLRDGESNLLAGLLREDERRALRGIVGVASVPGFRDLFSSNDRQIAQTDIVMLLTPHIIRSRNVSETDLRPVAIGSQQSLSLGGAPLVLMPPRADGPPAAENAPAPPTAPPAPAPVATPAAPAAPATDVFPGAALTTSGAVQVTLTPPGPTMRMGGGPYTVALAVSGANRVSTISMTVAFDPTMARVRTVQEGTFMRAGGAEAAFVHQVAPGRVDISVTRASGALGASGSGILGVILFEPLAPGTVTLTPSGAATAQGGAPVDLRAVPVTITVER